MCSCVGDSIWGRGSARWTRSSRDKDAHCGCICQGSGHQRNLPIHQLVIYILSPLPQLHPIFFTKPINPLSTSLCKKLTTQCYLRKIGLFVKNCPLVDKIYER